MNYIVLSEQRVPLNHGAYYIADPGYDIFNGICSFSFILIKVLLILLLATCVCFIVESICKKYKKHRLEMDFINERLIAIEKEIGLTNDVEECLNSNEESTCEEKEKVFLVDENGNISKEKIEE